MYVDATQSSRKFQIKPWYGGTDDAKKEFEDGAVSCCVAYLRSAENEVVQQEDNGKYVYFPSGEDAATYQIQLWKNVDLFTDVTSAIPQKGERWQLIKATDPGKEKKMLSFGSYTRLPLQNPHGSDYITLKINTAKFAPGEYQYMLISLDKLEEKLHLISKYISNYPTANDEYTYEHIEDDILTDLIFQNTVFPTEQPGLYHPWNDNDPIVLGPITETWPLSPEITQKVISLTYNDSEDDEIRQNSDFILVIKKN